VICLLRAVKGQLGVYVVSVVVFKLASSDVDSRSGSDLATAALCREASKQ
jgi:hypothetical protein